jgi:putative ABC transport system permease protein
VRLFRWFILRRLLHEPLRSGLTALGIALGVAVVVAIQLTNASSLAGFEAALNTVSGRTSLEIVGIGAGIDEQRLPELGWLRDYGEVAPVIEGDLVYRQAGRPTEILRLLGVDILRDQPFRDYNLLEWAAPPDRAAGAAPGRGAARELKTQEFLGLLLDPESAIIAARFAEPRALKLGSTLTVNVGDRTVPLKIRGLLRDEGPARVLDGRFVLMDIAAAQQVLNRFGRVDRVEIRLTQPASIDIAERAIAERLPPGLSVQRPARRGRQVEQMLAAFHLNLTALSYVALLVGLFLVYNTVSVAVLSRRTEIGTLRGLGVTRGHVRALFLAEAAALAAVGSAAGVLLGRLLADATVALTSTTVSALYIATAAAPPALTWSHVLLAFGTGVPLSLLAALVPALEASRVPPTAAMRGADQLDSRTRFPYRPLGFGLCLLVLGAWLATLGPVRGLPLFGYASAIVIVFGASCVVPAMLFAIAHGSERPVRRFLKVEDWLAVTNLSAAVPRLSISVAALAVSLSMMVAISVMIGSFRETVIYWVGQTLQADLFVSPGSRHQGGADDALSEEVIRAVTTSTDVEAVDRFGSTEVAYGDTRIRVGGGEFDVLLGHGRLLFKAPADARDAMRRAIGQDAVVASESFVIKQRLGVGSEVQLPTPKGPVPFRIAAVYYDYSSDRGVVVMDRRTFERHYGAVPIGGLSLYLRNGVDPEQARERLLVAIGDSHRVLINTNRSLRTEVLRIFDSTFAITYALEIIAILVAILGVSGTLLTLILEREPELTVLRLIGTGRREIRRMIIGEALLIGAISQAVGLIAGLLLSLVLIYVINVQSFGWTIQFHLPVVFLLQASVLMILATGLAGLYPARRAQQLGTYEHPPSL